MNKARYLISLVLLVALGCGGPQPNTDRLLGDLGGTLATAAKGDTLEVILELTEQPTDELIGSLEQHVGKLAIRSRWDTGFWAISTISSRDQIVLLTHQPSVKSIGITEPTEEGHVYLSGRVVAREEDAWVMQACATDQLCKEPGTRFYLVRVQAPGAAVLDTGRFALVRGKYAGTSQGRIIVLVTSADGVIPKDIIEG